MIFVTVPKVKLPTTPKGWLVVTYEATVTLAASMVGFIAGAASLVWLSERFSR